MINLSAAQKRTLAWVGKGWSGTPGPGSAVLINGKRICNTDTMMALKRAGLVDKNDHNCWTATEAGKDLAAKLGL